ncbi:MAG: choline dehydrogenase [Proteobacteria bacterium]|nr:choline dehydrogenase [Pseudomonadota bacterium]
MADTYDYIVVGAGSAGCVLAGRLSEDPATRVLLLEAGPPDRSLWIHLPIGYGKTMWSDRYNWRFQTDPDPNMHGRRIYWPRGKTLGGSSAINGLIYIRGQREDYDHWADLGCAGWGYDDVLPWFIRAEGNERGASRYHGGDGPLKVSDIPGRHPLIDAFVAGAGTLGVPATDDFNGATQEGAGYFQLTTHRGWRCSTADAYLKPARGRPNLTVATEAQATAVLFDGKRAIGVRYRQGGRDIEARCDAEVLLAAGAIQSPQLLQLSGVGPPALLAQFGIPLVHALDAVGENLQDHLQFRLAYECTEKITTNDDLNSLFGRIKLGWQWLSARSGALAIGINQGACFMRALPESTTPDIQFHVATLSADMAGGAVHAWPGFTFSVCQLRPSSRGRIALASADPFAPPSMQANYLDTELDRRCAVAAVKAARAIAASAPMARYVKREVKPGPGVASDADLLDWCRDVGATIFHPSGTCRMGVDANAVVDPRLRVRGVQALRVVDASIVPTVPSGNTNAPVVMIAEKAVAMIREDRKRGGRTAQDGNPTQHNILEEA